jgi:phosphoribosylformylglycinamidine (FGAM) synthase-like amidotransferase family enzyme
MEEQLSPFILGFLFSQAFLSYLIPTLCSLLGWAAAVTFNPQARTELRRFKRRPDTFSLGVCNGCQLLALLGWVGGDPSEEAEEWGHDSWPAQPGLLLRHNLSGRFESRWASVRVGPSPALMLQGMEGAVLPVWSAHGEGQVWEDAKTGVRDEPEGAWFSLPFSFSPPRLHGIFFSGTSSPD